jgi:hypothetical protein
VVAIFCLSYTFSSGYTFICIQLLKKKAKNGGGRLNSTVLFQTLGQQNIKELIKGILQQSQAGGVGINILYLYFSSVGTSEVDVRQAHLTHLKQE